MKLVSSTKKKEEKGMKFQSLATSRWMAHDIRRPNRFDWVR